MIRFIRLLFYHIYIYYYKKDNGNKPLAKFTTLLIFTLIFSFFIIGCNDIIRQNLETNYKGLERTAYISIFVIIGIILAYYLYKEGFENFDSFKDYHKKYYLYFFMIVLATLCLVVYTGKTSRERIFKQREMQKAPVEMKK